MDNTRKRKENKRIVGNYELLELLGTGSFSSVWLAQHTITNFYVAIKIVNRRTLLSIDSKMRFNNELLLLKKLHHPFIAGLFEIIEDNDAVYCVLENVEQGSLLDYINSQGTLDEAKARRYFSQIISALDYLHNTKFIVHRDLKAENILIDKYDNIRLIDFGFSSEFSKLKPELSTACGSPAYAAPEMIQGYNYTKSADIWSAGVVLYAMVAGILPFDDENTQTLLQKIVYTDVVYPPTMSRSLIDLLKRMLIKNPHKRLSISQICQHPWFTQGDYAPIIGFNFNLYNNQHFCINSINEGDNFPVCSNVTNNPNFIDKSIVEEMKTSGYDVSSLGQLLLLDEFSKPVTTIYRILLKNKMTEATRTVMETLSKKSLWPNSCSLLNLNPPESSVFNSSPNINFSSTKNTKQEIDLNLNQSSHFSFNPTLNQLSYLSYDCNQTSNLDFNISSAADSIHNNSEVLDSKSISSSPMPLYSFPTSQVFLDNNSSRSCSDIYSQQNNENGTKEPKNADNFNNSQLQQQVISSLDLFPSQNPQQQPQIIQLTPQTPVFFPKKTRMSLQSYIPPPPINYLNSSGNLIQMPAFQYQFHLNQMKTTDSMSPIFPNTILNRRRRMSRPLP